MKIFLCLSIYLVLGQVRGFVNDIFDFTNLTDFPKNFIFSSASASYQVEGAWNISGKGENIWDHITHKTPDFVAKRYNGDVACDSYHKYKEDVQNMKKIGFKAYRFSLSWSRLFPDGTTSYMNPDGVRYYNALINELLANGIEPMVTLYHWDLPQPFQASIGGWLDSRIVDLFGNYARAVFKLFGDRVKWWFTINEPMSIVSGYGGYNLAPALNLHGTGEYESGHNLLKAHARAYRIYEKEFKQTQGGKVSIVIDGGYMYPKNPSNSDDVAAAERAIQFSIGRFAHPIFSKEGDYPPVMREYVDRNSKAEGRNVSRLPIFTKGEIEELRGSYDFFALNHYSSHAVEPGLYGPVPSSERDQETAVGNIDGAAKSACSWLTVIPEGFRDLLNWLKNRYHDPEIIVTENGYCDTGEEHDTERVQYYQGYLRNLLAAIKEDNVKVLGYTVWSIIDNFEWKDGYTKKFGIMKVDFDSPERPRSMKLSAEFFKQLIKKNSDLGNLV